MYAISDQYKKAAVFGAGRSGRAAMRLLNAVGMPACLLEKEATNIPADFKIWL